MDPQDNQQQQIDELRVRVARLERAVNRLWYALMLGAFILIVWRYGMWGVLVTLALLAAFSWIKGSEKKR